MNKNVLIGGAVIVIAIVLTVLFSGGGSGDTNSKSGEEVKGVFSEILRSGKDMTCDFESVQEGGTTVGSVYIADAGERIRGDFTFTSADGEMMDGSLIRKENVNYVWGPSFDQGVKTKVPEEERDSLFTKESDVDVNEDTEFDCRTWKEDSSVFNVPDDIEFIDFSTQVDAMMNVSSDLKLQQCAACDQISDPTSQSQCRAALGC